MRQHARHRRAALGILGHYLYANFVVERADENEAKNHQRENRYRALDLSIEVVFVDSSWVQTRVRVVYRWALFFPSTVQQEDNQIRVHIAFSFRRGDDSFVEIVWVSSDKYEYHMD